MTGIVVDIMSHIMTDLMSVMPVIMTDLICCVCY